MVQDPKYVEEPEAFRPERWLPHAVESRKGTEAEVTCCWLVGNEGIRYPI